MSNKILLAALYVSLIFCQAAEARSVKYSSEQRLLDDELDAKDDEKNTEIIFSNATKNLSNFDLKDAGLVNVKKSIQIQREGSCKKDKIAEIAYGHDYHGILAIKYQSGITGFFGLVDNQSGNIAQQYFVPRGLVSAKVGDEVELCLVQKDECLPMDDRGNFYKATNLRTKKSWVLRNSIKSCGEDFVWAKSINCEAAKGEDEKIICQNSELKFLDELVAAQYQNYLSTTRAARKSVEKVKKSQISWLKSRALCKTHECLRDSYQQRLQGLDGFLSGPGNLKFLGTCSKDKIKTIASELPNGVKEAYLEYYSSEQIYAPFSEDSRSKIDDDVVICYHSSPINCPVDDNRGASFKTFNLRTHESWILSKTRRSCGGA